MGSPRPKLKRELAAILLAAAVFAWLAAAVEGGRASAFDAAVRGQVHAEAFPALTYLMRGFSTMGEAVFLIILGGLVVWRLLAAGRRREASFLAAAAIGAELIDQALKMLFHRTRPEAFFGVSPDNYSFPSGHALVSFSFYLVLAEIFIEEEWPRGRRFGARAVALLLAGCIGLSRVYLGVHYPTDVLGGYAAAIVWLSVLWSVYKLKEAA